jgi:thioredoxin-related protein
MKKTTPILLSTILTLSLFLSSCGAKNEEITPPE